MGESEGGWGRGWLRRGGVVTALEGVADLYGAVAEEKEVCLTVSYPKRLEINGDAALIQQAVANLVDNAVKFSPGNGTVKLTAALEGHRIRITVTDQRPGIPE